MKRLCEEAGTSEPDALLRVERENEDRQRLEARLAANDRELAMVAIAGADALRAEVAALAGVDLDARQREVDASVARLTESARALRHELGAVDGELKKVSGGDDAAVDEAALQGVVASIGETAAEYLRFAFAAQLLRQATESYREKNQSPMLLRTSELLAALTLGSFRGVEVDEEDEKSVIKGVRGGARVGVEGMSDGVRDQLFLALRLAALERQLARREALPFVVDDILINLSDARARATLEVLADLGAKTQVLLFTHHSRVAELARDLPGRDVLVHAIARGA
jgi:chromosome segregation protein